MYRITYEQGNGYRCSCCRRTSTETIDFETREEVVEWLSELEACQTISEWEDDDDRYVEEIREVKDEDLTDSFKADKLITEAIISKRKADKEEKDFKQKQITLERKKNN